MINQDGTLNSPANPAPQGSIVTVYATGLNNTQPPLATGAIAQAAAPLALAGQLSMCCAGLNSATVTYAGAAPTMVAGLVQINFQVPATTSPGFASLYIFFLNEVSSQPLYYYRK
jgi:uncharacterized protein (TIGR03437 family)